MRISDWSSDVCSSDLTATGPFFRAADVVAFPSRHEPFGTVSLEAWAYGKPLVTTDVDGPAELVRPDEDALVVPKDDVAALAQALRRAIEDRDLAARLSPPAPSGIQPASPATSPFATIWRGSIGSGDARKNLVVGQSGSVRVGLGG